MWKNIEIVLTIIKIVLLLLTSLVFLIESGSKKINPLSFLFFALAAGFLTESFFLIECLHSANIRGLTPFNIKQEIIANYLLPGVNVSIIAWNCLVLNAEIQVKRLIKDYVDNVFTNR